MTWLNVGLSQVRDTIPMEAPGEGRLRYKTLSTQWLMLDMGVNMFVNQSPGGDLEPFELETMRSFQFNLHVFRQRVNLYQKKLNIEYGFTMVLNRFELANPYTLAPYGALVTPTFVDTVTFKCNTFKATSFAVPLLFRFESAPFRRAVSFHVAAGGFAAIQFGARQRQKTTQGFKETVRGYYNLPDIRYGCLVEMGFGYLTLYGKVDMNRFFIASQSNGYLMNAASVGVRIIPHW